jgi:hypothetical protein
VGKATYYDRQADPLPDGTFGFTSAMDRQHEREVSELISRVWKCELRPFGPLCAVDWYAIRDGRLAAILELKSRSHDSGKYPTVFLNVRKWFALYMGSIGLNVPAFFVVRFQDGVRWISLAEIDARQHQMGGCRKIVKSHTDIEPIIHIPVEMMKPLEG